MFNYIAAYGVTDYDYDLDKEVVVKYRLVHFFGPIDGVISDIMEAKELKTIVNVARKREDWNSCEDFRVNDVKIKFAKTNSTLTKRIQAELDKI